MTSRPKTSSCPGKLTRSAGGSDRHGDGDAHRLVVGEVGSSLGERSDVLSHSRGFVTGEARHPGVGVRDVSESEDGCLTGYLEGIDLDEAVRAACGCQFLSEVVAVGHHAVAAIRLIGELAKSSPPSRGLRSSPLSTSASGQQRRASSPP
jgi:hypothetical protein